MKTPCKNCTERHVGCHVNCEKYKEFKKELDELNKKKRGVSQCYVVRK